MPPSTDYVEHLAKLARKLHLDSGLGGGPPQPDAQFYKVMAKALDEIAGALKGLSQRE